MANVLDYRGVSAFYPKPFSFITTPTNHVQVIKCSSIVPQLCLQWPSECSKVVQIRGCFRRARALLMVDA